MTIDDKSNFETLRRAAANGDLALMECADAATLGELQARRRRLWREKEAAELHLLQQHVLAHGTPAERLAMAVRLQVARDHPLYDQRLRELKLLRWQFPAVWAAMRREEARARYVQEHGDDWGFE